ncbi:MAG: hypothetical protein N4A44_04650 [Alphaproteobacteria bacterium]|jgi:hypothetical protein|nr:hypothetical protein [Alphaproteobacteria bacterium]
MSQKILYSEYDDGVFEDIVYNICYNLLGPGVKKFSKGKDGGRDAFFEGVSELYPSSKSTMSGKMVIQAKHTINKNSTFSDNDFFKNNSSIINKEIIRIKKLYDAKKLDHYFLFANRRLSSISEMDIKKYISNKVGISESNIHLFGTEEMDDWLFEFPKIQDKIEFIRPFDNLKIDFSDLKDLLIGFKKEFSSDKLIPVIGERIKFDEKNKINNLSEYYSDKIKEKYLHNFYKIKNFLEGPEEQKLYNDVIDGIDTKVAMLSSSKSFDLVFEAILDYFFERDNVFSSNKLLTKTFVYYMYYHCDIGKK